MPTSAAAWLTMNLTRLVAFIIVIFLKLAPVISRLQPLSVTELHSNVQCFRLGALSFVRVFLREWRLFNQKMNYYLFYLEPDT